MNLVYVFGFKIFFNNTVMIFFNGRRIYTDVLFVSDTDVLLSLIIFDQFWQGYVNLVEFFSFKGKIIDFVHSLYLRLFSTLLTSVLICFTFFFVHYLNLICFSLAS